MAKKLIIALVMVAVLGGGGWYYFTQIDSTPIGKIKGNAKEYQGKLLAISGEVTDRGNLLILKYYTLKDNTGEIKVITEGMLPGTGAKLRIKGKIDEYALGSEQFLVFKEQVRP